MSAEGKKKGKRFEEGRLGEENTYCGRGFFARKKNDVCEKLNRNEHKKGRSTHRRWRKMEKQSSGG